MCAYVCTCMYVCMCGKCLRRSEEGVRSLGDGVTGISEPVDSRIWIPVLRIEQQKLISNDSSWIVLSTCYSLFFIRFNACLHGNYTFFNHFQGGFTHSCMILCGDKQHQIQRLIGIQRQSQPGYSHIIILLTGKAQVPKLTRGSKCLLNIINTSDLPMSSQVDTHT